MAPADHYLGEVAQKAIIEKGGKILLVKAPGEDKFDLPGGRLHKAEKPALGLAREIREELGVSVTVGQAVFADMWSQSAVLGEEGQDRYFVAFSCTLENEDEPLVLQKEEIESIQWITKEELDTVPLYKICKDALTAYFSVR